MRSLTTSLLVSLLIGTVACERRHNGPARLLVSTADAGDPNVAAHFVKGFYGVEQNAWRWTDKQFSVDLSPPLHSDQKGAQLTLKLVVPDITIQKVNSVELSAGTQGYKLEPQTFTKGGQYTYVRDIPADKLQGDSVRIDFALDHALPPSAEERRELGIIVSGVGLTVK